jgi:hypothetical protein
LLVEVLLKGRGMEIDSGLGRSLGIDVKRL